ncbi:MAG: hypothetical protein JWM32_2100 [Verrucomicrobia bacterium]|nr:hypothetical protein [Verrucomicrobiota bacterium]
MRWLHGLLVFAALACVAWAAETIPPAPPNHFNDYAHVVSAGTAGQLNDELDQFERATSNQILVAIYPHMTSDSSVEDYTVRVAQAWGVGQKGKKNGAVLFIFSEDRKLFIQVGYGLERVLPDAVCKRIVEDEITPRFRAGDFTGGVEAGVHAMLAAARGEYQGTGSTAADLGRNFSGHPGLMIGLFILFIVISSLFRRRRGVISYGRGGMITYGLFGGGGGSSSNRSSGGGTFSGGGGSFGGGGAGGSW